MTSNILTYFKSLIILFLKNPIILWFKQVYDSFIIISSNIGNNLEFSYNTKISNCTFSLNNRIGHNTQIFNCSLGDYSYIADYTILNNTHIGKYTSIGPYVLAGLGKHPTDSFVSTHPFFYSSFHNPYSHKKSKFVEYLDVKIGNDVWIGARVIILDGISIGDGAIVAAGSIVTRDVLPYSIVGGTPAKLLKFRFDIDKINLLNNFKWWEKDYNWISSNIGIFDDPDSFFYKIKTDFH